MLAKSKKLCFITFAIAICWVFVSEIVLPDYKIEAISKSIVSPMTIGYKQKYGVWPSDMDSMLRRLNKSSAESIYPIIREGFTFRFSTLPKDSCKIGISRGKDGRSYNFIVNLSDDPKGTLKYAYFE